MCAPRLGRQAERLRGEHKELFLEFCDLVERAERMFYDEQHAARRSGSVPNSWSPTSGCWGMSARKRADHGRVRSGYRRGGLVGARGLA